MEKPGKQPLVSVIMATFNEPVEHLRSAVESILEQTYQHIELLIADDSTDTATIKAIDVIAASDARIIVIRQQQKMGFVQAINTALSEAKGELIARMDADDIALPDRIANQVAYAAKHPEIDLFGGHIYIIDANDKVTSLRKYKVDSKSFTRMFVYRNPLAHPTIMFRRTIIEQGYMYDPSFKKAEDLEFYLRLYNHGFHLGNMDEFLLKYRIIGDMQKKRQYDNWCYNHKARARNFNWHKPLFSICSWIVSFLYIYIPNRLISFFYKRENNKKNY